MPFPALTNATTADLIRDRMITVIEGITPTILPASKFKRYRNEGKGDFIAWAGQEGGAAFRRFQVRTQAQHELPITTNTDFEERHEVFTVEVAYPQTSRTGTKEALDRDTAIDRDHDAIELAIGIYGRANFSAPNPDAVCINWHATRQTHNAVDYLVAEVTMRFIRQLF